MRVRGASIAAFLLLLSWAQELDACSCVPRVSPAQRFSGADLVFVGQVVEIDDRMHLFRRIWTYASVIFGWEISNDDYERRYGFDITLRVERMWRGPAARTVRLLTGRGGGDCGVEFERGKRYLVYAYRRKSGEWGTDLCARTHEMPMTKDEAAFLATVKPLAITE